MEIVQVGNHCNENSSNDCLQSSRLAQGGAKRRGDGTAAVNGLRYLQVKLWVWTAVSFPLLSAPLVVQSSIWVHLRGNKKWEWAPGSRKRFGFLSSRKKWNISFQTIHSIRYNTKTPMLRWFGDAGSQSTTAALIKFHNIKHISMSLTFFLSCIQEIFFSILKALKDTCLSNTAPQLIRIWTIPRIWSTLAFAKNIS